MLVYAIYEEYDSDIALPNDEEDECYIDITITDLTNLYNFN
jgi:hypothetical protein